MKKLKSYQYGLSLHTNTPRLGLSINNFNGDSRSQVWELGRDLSSNLHQLLIEFIKPQTWDNIAFLGVTKGPGGFTGTRVGMVIALTLAQQLNIPMYSISNLEAIAHFHLHKFLLDQNYDNNLLAVEMEAKRGRIFGGIYEVISENRQIKTYLEDNTYLIEEWREILNKLPQKYTIVLPPENIAQTSVNILEIAYSKWQEGIIYNSVENSPFYGQHPVNS